MAVKNGRVLQFALVGLLIALVFEAVGYHMEHALPRLALNHQAFYNWLTLVFTPMAFLLRLGSPDGPIISGWGSLLIVALSNTMLYASFCKAGQLLFLRLHQKLVMEGTPRQSVKETRECVARFASAEANSGRS